MSNSVLRSPRLADAPVVMGSDGFNSLPPAMAAMIERVRSDAHDAGYRTGRADALAEAQSLIDQASHTVRESVDRAREDMEEAIRTRTPDVIALAIELARLIVGAAADAAAEGLAQRVMEAISQVDDPTMTVTVHPGDLEGLRRVLPPDITLEPDPGLAPGDARAIGRWARVDLTIETAWKNIAAAFDA